MANVNSAAVQKAMQLCQKSIDALNKAGKDVQSKYQQAGQGWKDSKYAELGGIVGECVNALKSPISQLGDCMSRLGDLAAAIVEYEQVNF